MPIEQSSQRGTFRIWVGYLLSMVLSLPLAALGEEGAVATAPPGSEPPSAAANVAPLRDEKALDLLKRMSETLAAANAFTYHSRSAIELRAKTGQFVTLFGESEVALQRPNKLHVKVTGEVPNFELYYDGQ